MNYNKRKVLMKKKLLKLFFITSFLYCSLPYCLFSDQVHTGEIIVQFKAQTQKSLLKAQGLKRLHKQIHTKKARSQADWEDLLDNPSVEYVEWDYLYSLSEVKASLNLFSIQTLSQTDIQDFYEFSGQLLKTSSQDEEVFIERNVSQVYKKPIIAVIDTGIDSEHKIFQESQVLWRNEKEISENGIDDDKNGFIDDREGWNFVDHNNDITDNRGHGTYVSGIILGSFVNIFSEKVKSVPFQIMPLKVFRLDGKAPSSSIANAVYYAVDHGASFLNLSFGSLSYSHTLHKALAYAYRKGVFISAASGNETLNLDKRESYPAVLPIPSLISVASINGKTNQLSGFSNYGKNKVILAAPGENILTSSPNNLFVPVSGTSMSTPFITAFATYISMKEPSLSSYQIHQAIEQSTTKNTTLDAFLKSGGFFKKISKENFHNLSTDFYSSEAPDYNEGSYLPMTQAQFLGGGCGTIAYRQTKDSLKRPFNSFQPVRFFLISFLLLLPLLLIFFLKSSVFDKRRKFERFSIQWQANLSSSLYHLLQGQIDSFSLGGLAFSCENSFYKNIKENEKVSLLIKNTKLEGLVRWISKEKKTIGIEFTNESRIKAEELLENALMEKALMG